jgi:TP901 family phage tail tape measure protein
MAANGEKIGSGYVEARLDTSQLAKDSAAVERDISSRFKATGEKLTSVGKTLTKRVTAPVLAMGTAIVKAAGNFESSMNNVRAVTGATGQEFDNLRNLAMELGRTTQFSASEAADAMYFLASAGFDTTQVMEAMPGVLNLAAAAQMDLATATDIASNILSAFGMEASDLGRVNDALVTTFQSTNTNVAQLGEAMKFAAPVANGLGVEMEDVAAAIGLMGNAGIQGGMAGTSLRMAMTALAQETGPAADIMQRLGINAMDAEGNLRPLDEIIRQLENSGASAGDMMALFGQRAGPAMMTLVDQGSDALGNLGTKIRESGGIAETVAGIQMEGFNGSLARMKSAVEGAAIAIGDSGLLANAAAFLEMLAGWAQKLAETNPALLGFVTLSAGIAAAVGPAAWAIGGMITGFGKLLAVVNPYTLAIAAVVTGIGFFVKAKMEAKQRVEDLTAAIEADSGALADNAEATIKARLADEGAIAAARDLGISYKTLMDAALGNAAATAEVEAKTAAALLAMDTASSDEFSDSLLAGGQSAVILQGALGLLAPDIAEAGRNAAYMAGETTGSADAMERWAGVAGEGADAAAGFTAALDDNADASTGAEEALTGYLDAIRRATEPVYNLMSAVEDVDAAQASYNDAVKEYGTDSREASDAAINLARQVGNLESAALDGDLSFGEFSVQLGKWVEQGRLTAEQAATIRGRVAEARGEAEDYQGNYNANVTATVDRASIQRSADALDRIARSRTVTFNTQVRGSASDVRLNNFGGARASGGPVTAGRSYLVGEEGPELWTAQQSGTIIPHAPSMGMLAGGASSPGTGGSVRGGGSGASVEFEVPHGASRGRLLIDDINAAANSGAKINARVLR